MKIEDTRSRTKTVTLGDVDPFALLENAFGQKFMRLPRKLLYTKDSIEVVAIGINSSTVLTCGTKEVYALNLRLVQLKTRALWRESARLCKLCERMMSMTKNEIVNMLRQIESERTALAAKERELKLALAEVVLAAPTEVVPTEVVPTKPKRGQGRLGSTFGLSPGSVSHAVMTFVINKKPETFRRTDLPSKLRKRAGVSEALNFLVRTGRLKRVSRGVFSI